uniref:Uncharacterized protein n=1 Tax=Pristionchus pacificus TaxID=54126 RepID=A0A2A6BUA6_PRIPA|eukprot:PDM69494.1 hypothetical protein PRIPAC_44590 [Pristionchus pacificus]
MFIEESVFRGIISLEMEWNETGQMRTQIFEKMTEVTKPASPSPTVPLTSSYDFPTNKKQCLAL